MKKLSLKTHNASNKSLDRRPRSRFLIISPVFGAAPVSLVVGRPYIVV